VIFEIGSPNPRRCGAACRLTKTLTATPEIPLKMTSE
jgi:hypothetical protein